MKKTIIFVAETCGNPGPLVTGVYYVQDELFWASSSEETRGPTNARLDWEGGGIMLENDSHIYMVTIVTTTNKFYI